MAKKPPKPTLDEDDEVSPATKDAKKLIAEALKRYKLSVGGAEGDNRKNYREDMLFTYKPGEQWLDADRTDRGKDRPMYEFNETRVNAMSVINHIRANRPSAKIRGVEEGDKELAEIRQGLYLNITNNSDFDSTKDYAAGHQVGGGYGAWRIDTEYSTDTAWDQDIVIKPFINPLCLVADHAAKDELKRDAKYWFVHSKITREEYAEKYKGKEATSFEPDDDLGSDLDDEDSVWVAEYWKKVPATKTICLLSSGESVEKKPDTTYPEGVTVVKERKVNTSKIVQYIISSSAVLEGPNDWAGSMFPFVPVYGYYMIIDGKPYWCGLTRYQKDPQRALNWALTSVYETVSSAPQAKWWATPKQALGHTDKWAEANKKNYPYMLYNHDPEAPGAPPRMGGADVPSALIAAAGMARDAMKASVGIFNASIGQTSNETSGKAIRARQDEGMVATFNFGDNMAKSERRTCEIVNDLYPHIYDTKRTIRILGQDGAEKFVNINAIDPMTGEVINDMSKGKFDFVITTGPSFATQRVEAAEFYGQMMQTNPAFAAAASDLVLKAQDYPMAEAMSERMKLMLPPQIQQAINKDKPMPPEVAAAMAQVDQMQQMLQQQAQELQQAQSEVQGQQADAVKAKSAVDVRIADLKIQQARFEVDVANFKTFVAQTEAQQAEANAGKDNEVEQAQLGAQLDQALGQISQQAAGLFQQYASQLAQMHGQALATAQPQVIVPPRPRVTGIRRENGKLIPEYEDQMQAGQAMPAGVQ